MRKTLPQAGLAAHRAWKLDLGADLKLGLNTEGTEKHREHGEALAYKWAAKNRLHRGGAEYAEKRGDQAIPILRLAPWP